MGEVTQRVLLADDEPLALGRLRRILAECPGVAIVGEATDGQSLAAALATTDAEVLLLDIEMPGADVFQVLRQVTATARPAIVFVTAFDRYAARAFEIEAVDYLLKPVTRERLAAALGRVAKRLAAGSGGDLAWQQSLRVLAERQRQLERALEEVRTVPTPRLLVKKDGREFVVDLSEAEAIESARNYVKLHLATGEQHLARVSLTALEHDLDPERFVRIHRGTILNLAWLKEVQPWFSGDSVVVTKKGRKFRMSRRFRDNFYRLFRGAKPGSTDVAGPSP